MSTASGGAAAEWEWKSSRGWVAYDADISTRLEKAYREKSRQCKVRAVTSHDNNNTLAAAKTPGPPKTKRRRRRGSVCLDSAAFATHVQVDDQRVVDMLVGADRFVQRRSDDRTKTRAVRRAPVSGTGVVLREIDANASTNDPREPKQRAPPAKKRTGPALNVPGSVGKGLANATTQDDATDRGTAAPLARTQTPKVPWTKEEDGMLLKMVQAEGTGNWADKARRHGHNRSSASLQQRWPVSPPHCTRLNASEAGSTVRRRDIHQ